MIAQNEPGLIKSRASFKETRGQDFRDFWPSQAIKNWWRYTIKLEFSASEDSVRRLRRSRELITENNRRGTESSDDLGKNDGEYNSTTGVALRGGW